MTSLEKKNTLSKWREIVHSETVKADMGVDPHLVGRHSPLKRKFFEVLYHSNTEIVILIMALLSIMLMVIEIMQPSFQGSSYLRRLKAMGYHSPFVLADVFITLLFTIEYCLKFWLAPKKWRFITGTWIDLVAIFPLLRVFRLGRAGRLFRLFRLVRILRFGSLLEKEALKREEKSETFVVGIYLLFSVVLAL